MGARYCRGTVRPAPPDGDCLFHALASGVGHPHVEGADLRRWLADFVRTSPNLVHNGVPLKEWTEWCGGAAGRGRRWGGALELAAFPLRFPQYAVWQCAATPTPGVYRVESEFCGDGSGTRRIVAVLYNGTDHYDGLDVTRIYV